MVYINVQANNMDFVILPDGRYLDARNQFECQTTAGNLGARGWNGIGCIVIGYGQRANPHFNGTMHQRFGRQQTIGGLGMAV